MESCAWIKEKMIGINRTMERLKIPGLVWLILLAAPVLGFGQSNSGAYEVSVRFTSFSATAKSWNLILLNWVTEAEVIHKKFEIQRSLNGIDFSPIGSIPSLDTYNGPKSYNFHDDGLLP